MLADDASDSIRLDSYRDPNYCISLSLICITFYSLYTCPDVAVSEMGSAAV